METLLTILIVIGIFTIAFLLAFVKHEKKQSKICQKAWKDKLNDSIEKAKPNWDKVNDVDKFMEELR